MDPGDVQVWLAPADLDDAGLAVVMGRLDDAARERAARFVRHEDQVRSAVGRDLLNRMVGQALGVPPDRIGLERRCLVCGDAGHGKPRPTVDGVVVDLETNLSHAAGLVALAVAPPGLPVGVDVEFRRDRVDWASLRRAVFTPGQWELTAAHPEPERTRWQWWSRKEAVVKASGHGLAVSLAKVEIEDPGVIRNGNAPEKEDSAGDDRQWFRVTHPVEGDEGVVGLVTDLAVPPGYVGALAALSLSLPDGTVPLPHVRVTPVEALSG
jgi:4'-phosphopantetheinyl transferase